MSLALLFWIIYLISAIWGTYSKGAPAWLNGDLVTFILVGLLGVAEFGWPIH